MKKEINVQKLKEEFDKYARITVPNNKWSKFAWRHYVGFKGFMREKEYQKYLDVIFRILDQKYIISHK